MISVATSTMQGPTSCVQWWHSVTKMDHVDNGAPLVQWCAFFPVLGMLGHLPVHATKRQFVQVSVEVLFKPLTS